MLLSPSAISALAVLGGSSVGALAPVLSSYVLQRSATRRDLMNREIADRQVLYSTFISEAARLYAHSATENSFDLNDVVGLYALVSRIRLVASEVVVQAAEEITKTIISRYGEDNISLESLRTQALHAPFDPLSNFSVAARVDLRSLIAF